MKISLKRIYISKKNHTSGFREYVKKMSFSKRANKTILRGILPVITSLCLHADNTLHSTKFIQDRCMYIFQVFQNRLNCLIVPG